MSGDLEGLTNVPTALSKLSDGSRHDVTVIALCVESLSFCHCVDTARQASPCQGSRFYQHHMFWHPLPP